MQTKVLLRSLEQISHLLLGQPKRFFFLADVHFGFSNFRLIKKISGKTGTFLVTICFLYMIESIKHKGLKLLWEKDDPTKLPPNQVDKIRRILTSLDTMSSLEPLRHIPGYRLHVLRGRLKGSYAVSVTGNYRVIFRFEEESVFDIDFIDYH